jgi:hypothetical protein
MNSIWVPTCSEPEVAAEVFPYIFLFFSVRSVCWRGLGGDTGHTSLKQQQYILVFITKNLYFTILKDTTAKTSINS